MDINPLYQRIIKDLAQGKRPKIELPHETKDYLLGNLNSKEQEFVKILALTTYQRDLHFGHKISMLLLPRIEEFTANKDTLFLYLGLIQAQSASYLIRDGLPLPAGFTTHFINLLNHHDLEIVECAVQTIESFGPLAIPFKDSLLAILPSQTATLLSRKKRNIFSMISKMKKLYHWK